MVTAAVTLSGAAVAADVVTSVASIVAVYVMQIFKHKKHSVEPYSYSMLYVQQGPNTCCP